MNGPETFFVKAGYACNEAAVTYEKSRVGEYWTPERIRNAALFQYHVYELAGALARQHRLKTGLDIGCGPATKSAQFLAPVLEELILMDQPNCRHLVADLLPDAQFVPVDLETCRPSIDRSVDLIVCADVLEHLSDPSACLDFARTHLAQDGFAVFSTPERDALRGSGCNRSMHGAHVREWNVQEFRRLLEWKGFHVVRQAFYPAARLPVIEEWARILAPAALRPRKWKHCQAAICTR